jgi:hypothetical protein
MIELLTVPDWNSPPRRLDEWSSALDVSSSVIREPDGTTWLEVASLRLRGYVVIEEGYVTAINFELHDPDPADARALVEKAASALGWEVHEEDAEEES